jgi:hypothetical protein
MGEERAAKDRQAHREKWVLRTLLLGVVGLLTAAVLGSLDDIRRYVHIHQM